MVMATEELISALGSGVKRVEENEAATVVLQRRSLCASRDLSIGTIISNDDLIPLRPCPPEAFSPSQWSLVVGRTVVEPVSKGQNILRYHLR